MRGLKRLPLMLVKPTLIVNVIIALTQEKIFITQLLTPYCIVEDTQVLIIVCE